MKHGGIRFNFSDKSRNGHFLILFKASIVSFKKYFVLKFLKNKASRVFAFKNINSKVHSTEVIKKVVILKFFLTIRVCFIDLEF